MKQILSFMKKKDVSRRRGVNAAGSIWMRTQLSKMQKMNQGFISMTVGK